MKSGVLPALRQKTAVAPLYFIDQVRICARRTEFNCDWLATQLDTGRGQRGQKRGEKKPFGENVSSRVKFAAKLIYTNTFPKRSFFFLLMSPWLRQTEYIKHPSMGQPQFKLKQCTNSYCII